MRVWNNSGIPFQQQKTSNNSLFYFRKSYSFKKSFLWFGKLSSVTWDVFNSQPWTIAKDIPALHFMWLKTCISRTSRTQSSETEPNLHDLCLKWLSFPRRTYKLGTRSCLRTEMKTVQSYNQHKNCDNISKLFLYK